MQVLAHHGPNWTSEAVDTSTDGDVIAVAVGRTVMLYSIRGACNAELRATGYGGVVSVSFCQSWGLTHLLAVLTNESVLRVFDVAARRIVRNVCDGRNSLTDRPKGGPFAVRFFPGAPHTIFLLLSTGYWHLLQINTPKASLVAKGSLPVHTVSSLTSDSSRLYVSGADGNSSVLVEISLSLNRNGVSTTVVVRTQKITPFVTAGDISVRPNGNHLAVMSTRLTTPFIFKHRDGDGGLRDAVTEAVGLRDIARKGIRACVAWINNEYLVSSDARGSLTLWHAGSQGCIAREVACRPRAHMRQVVCIRTVRAYSRGGSPKLFPFILSASADRTVAMWAFPGVSEGSASFKLVWRSMCTTGAILELSLKHSRDECWSSGVDSNHADEEIILTFATSEGTVSSLLVPVGLPITDKSVCPVHVPQILSDLRVAAVNGGKLGKRTRGSKNGRERPGNGNGREDESASTLSNAKTIAGLTNSTINMVYAQFLTGDGNLGVIRRTTDGRITYSACKRVRGAGVATGTHGQEQGRNIGIWTMQTGFLEACDGHLLSLSVVESERKGGVKRWEVLEHPVASILNLQSRAPLLAVSAHPGLELFLVVCRDGSVWQCSRTCDPQMLYVWPSVTGPRGEGDRGALTCVAVAFDGTVALGTSQGEVIVSTPGACRSRKVESEGNDRKAEIAWQMAVAGKAPTARMRWSWDSRMIAVILGSGEVSIWARLKGSEEQVSDTMTEFTRIKVHYGAVKDAVWTSPRTLATGGSDGSLRLWDVSRLPKCCDESATRARKI